MNIDRSKILINHENDLYIVDVGIIQKEGAQRTFATANVIHKILRRFIAVVSRKIEKRQIGKREQFFRQWYEGEVSKPFGQGEKNSICEKQINC